LECEDGPPLAADEDGNGKTLMLLPFKFDEEEQDVAPLSWNITDDESSLD
jgi:aspartokinase-like uncharacterized kinase